MFITRTALPRRTFLRGVGATIALPLLDAMVPARTLLAQTPARPRPRVGFVYVPNGAIMEQWTPATAGPGFELSPTLQALAPFRDALVVVSHLACPEPDSSHAAAAASWLTGVAPKRTDGADFRAGTSIDQIIARQLGQETTFLSIEVGTDDFTNLVGGCSTGYSCAYINTLNWQTPTTPLPMEINPRAVFERLFGSGGSTREQRLAHLRTNHSILDFVSEELGDLERTLGPSDRTRLDQYLEHLREVERRIQRAEQQSELLITVPEAPVGVPEEFEEHVALMFELLALAYEADLTRVFTFMMARELSQRTYTQLGVSETHHRVSHHSNNPEKIEEHAKINAYHVGLFARFLARLRDTPDGDGSLLDHAVIAYGCGMGEGNTHSPYPLPMALVGKGCGRLAGNRHIVAPERTPIANLLWGLADAMDVPLEGFGAATGRLAI